MNCRGRYVRVSGIGLGWMVRNGGGCPCLGKEEIEGTTTTHKKKVEEKEKGGVRQGTNTGRSKARVPCSTVR